MIHARNMCRARTVLRKAKVEVLPLVKAQPYQASKQTDHEMHRIITSIPEEATPVLFDPGH